MPTHREQLILSGLWSADDVRDPAADPGAGVAEAISSFWPS